MSLTVIEFVAAELPPVISNIAESIDSKKLLYSFVCNISFKPCNTHICLRPNPHSLDRTVLGAESDDFRRVSAAILRDTICSNAIQHHRCDPNAYSKSGPHKSIHSEHNSAIGFCWTFSVARPVICTKTTEQLPVECVWYLAVCRSSIKKNAQRIMFKTHSITLSKEISILPAALDYFPSHICATLSWKFFGLTAIADCRPNFAANYQPNAVVVRTVHRYTAQVSGMRLYTGHVNRPVLASRFGRRATVRPALIRRAVLCTKILANYASGVRLVRRDYVSVTLSTIFTSSFGKIRVQVDIFVSSDDCIDRSKPQLPFVVFRIPNRRVSGVAKECLLFNELCRMWPIFNLLLYTCSTNIWRFFQ